MSSPTRPFLCSLDLMLILAMRWHFVVGPTAAIEVKERGNCTLCHFVDTHWVKIGMGTLASQPAVGHSLRFIFTISIMTLYWAEACLWGWPQLNLAPMPISVRN